MITKYSPTGKKIFYNREVNTGQLKTQIYEYFGDNDCETNEEEIFYSFSYESVSEFVDMFIELGTNINKIFQTTNFTNIFGKNRIMIKLLEYGLDPNLIIKESPLLVWVAIYGKSKTMEYLIKAGINLDFITDEGLSVYEYSLRNTKSKMVRLLIDCGCKSILSVDKLLKHSIRRSVSWVIDYIFENYEIDINYIDENGDSLLIYANKYCDLHNIEEILLEKNADVNIRNKENKSALYYAIKNGCFNLIEILLKYGADVREKENKLIIKYIEHLINYFPNYQKEFNEVRKKDPIYRNFDYTKTNFEEIYESINCSNIINENKRGELICHVLNNNYGYKVIKYFIVSGIIDIKDEYNYKFIRKLIYNKDIESANLFLELGFEVENPGEKYYVPYSSIKYDPIRNRFKALEKP